MTRNQRKWWYGLAAGFLGGLWASLDSGLAVMIIAPKEFNLDAGLFKTLVTMLILGLLSGAKVAVAYLKQSPMPPMEGDTEVFSKPPPPDNNMKIIMLITGLLLAAYVKTRAAETPPPPPAHFLAGEWNLDLYGTGTLANESRSKDDLTFGGGLALNYWITRGFGLGLKGETDKLMGGFEHSVVDRALGRVLVRAPLWDRVAPYGYVEGGYAFERNEWLAGTGGGLDFRLAKGWALFGEAGLQVSPDGRGSMKGSAGVRLIW